MKIVCICGNKFYANKWGKCLRCHFKDRTLTKCYSCGTDVFISYSQLRHMKFEKTRKGKLCNACRSSHFSNVMKNTRSKEDKADRIKRSIDARKMVKDPAAGVRKQWETLRSDPELFARASVRKSARSKKMWSLMTSEQKTARIRKSFLHGKQSAMAKRMKELMIDAGLKGFVSEEVFCGFIPDEINHELKIIVEFYGDLYHCRPDKYKNPDVYMKALDRTVGEQWSRDKQRLGCFYGHGYKVVIIWEGDFKKNETEQIDRIKEAVAHANHTKISSNKASLGV